MYHEECDREGDRFSLYEMFFFFVFVCVPEGWSAKPFGGGPFISQARMSFYQTDVSLVLLLEINTTNNDDILLVSEAHLSLI